MTSEEISSNLLVKNGKSQFKLQGFKTALREIEKSKTNQKIISSQSKSSRFINLSE